MENLLLTCLEEHDDRVLELEDNYYLGVAENEGVEVMFTIQDWGAVNAGVSNEPCLETFIVDRDGAEQIVDWLTRFYRLGGLH